MLDRDFTLKKDKELCDTILTSGYMTLTMSEYLAKKELYKDSKFVILRHDIDNKVDLHIALKMAEYEYSVGIKSSYYFRTVKDVFDINVIKNVVEYGHEVGYHYEVLNESKGDIELAFALLEENLNKFRKITSINTICQHGGSLGENTASTFKGLIKTVFKFINGRIEIKSYKSNDIWKERDFIEFGLLGEAYLSLDFTDIIYISDTGLRWDGYKNRVLDVVNSDYYRDGKTFAKTTSQLIELLKNNEYIQFNILAHPANWIDSFFPWFKWQLLQKFRNVGKKILLK